LATLADSAGGVLSLWVVAAGLIALAMWRLAETVLGLHPGESATADRRHSPVLDRLKAFGLALLYGAVAFTAIGFALGTRRQGSRQTAGLSARLMQSQSGKAILVIAGVVVFSIGAYYVYKGVSRRFLGDLCRPGGRVITILGIIGHAAEGSVLCAAGVSVIVATSMSDPARATGLDSAVKSLGSTRFGGVLLLLAATGFAAYGLYSCAMARYSRM
jgi:hypothetical protein